MTLPSEEVSGSLKSLTHAAEALASHAASQAAGLFSYRTEEEKKAEENPGAEEHAKQAEEVEATQESRHGAAVAPCLNISLNIIFQKAAQITLPKIATDFRLRVESLHAGARVCANCPGKLGVMSCQGLSQGSAQR